MCQVVLAIAVMVAQALPAPAALTCLFDSSQRLSGEQACCRHMPPACGSEKKQSSADCCVKTTGTDPQAASPELLTLDNTLASNDVLIPFIAGVNLHRFGGGAEWSQTHPPGPDLSETTHLRI
jgi:hypothetical protein